MRDEDVEQRLRPALVAGAVPGLSPARIFRPVLDEAFRLADRYFPDAALFINDYNTEMPEKRAATVAAGALVHSAVARSTLRRDLRPVTVVSAGKAAWPMARGSRNRPPPLA